MDEREFSLQELSEASGVEARTIRSYIERDLLPGPSSLGRNATYGPEHLDRLEVIRLLRDARRDLTLEKIRGLLAQLSPSEIAAVAAGRVQVGSLLASETPQLTSALDYLKGIASRTPSAPPTAAPVPAARVASWPAGGSAAGSGPASAAPGTRTPLEALLAALGQALGGESVGRDVRASTWYRLSITPDFELAVRGELDADQLAVLHRVGDHLRHLLTKGASR